jgi:hypothetical protein
MVLTAQVKSLHQAYNYWAILAMHAVASIFWLSAMADLASTRAAFKYPAIINECVNYGYGGVCDKRRDVHLGKRDGYVATRGYLNMMSAAAVFSAFEVLVYPLRLLAKPLALSFIY